MKKKLLFIFSIISIHSCCVAPDYSAFSLYNLSDKTIKFSYKDLEANESYEYYISKNSYFYRETLKKNDSNCIIFKRDDFLSTGEINNFSIKGDLRWHKLYGFFDPMYRFCVINNRGIYALVNVRDKYIVDDFHLRENYPNESNNYDTELFKKGIHDIMAVIRAKNERDQNLDNFKMGSYKLQKIK